MKLEKYSFGLGERYYNALKEFEYDISRNLTENLWVRNIKPLLIK